MAQDYENLEIIVVDDGSTDDTLDVIHEVVSNTNRVVHVLTQENGGQSSARNLGIRHSTGTYLYFLDSDDYIDVNTLSRCVEVIEKYQSDIVLFCGRSFCEEGINVSMMDYTYPQRPGGLYVTDQSLNKLQPNSTPCMYLFRRNLLDSKDLCFTEGIIHEDEIFTPRLFIRSTSIFLIKDILYHRRYRMNSTMTSVDLGRKERSYLGYKTAFHTLLDVYNKQRYLLPKSKRSYLEGKLLKLTDAVVGNSHEKCREMYHMINVYPSFAMKVKYIVKKCRRLIKKLIKVVRR